jgi:hypothetical protein
MTRQHYAYWTCDNCERETDNPAHAQSCRGPLSPGTQIETLEQTQRRLGLEPVKNEKKRWAR